MQLVDTEWNKITAVNNAIYKLDAITLQTSPNPVFARIIRWIYSQVLCSKKMGTQKKKLQSANKCVVFCHISTFPSFRYAFFFFVRPSLEMRMNHILAHRSPFINKTHSEIYECNAS